MPALNEKRPAKTCAPHDVTGLPVFRLDGLEAAGGIPFLCRLVPALRDCGLRVAVVFTGQGGPAAEPLPADWRQVFAAGGDVVSLGAERLCLSHAASAPERIRLYLSDLCQRYDLVLAAGATDPAFPALRLPGGETAADPSACVQTILDQLQQTLRQVPVWACVLIGGRSSRMGRAKHLLADSRGRTWLENTVAVLAPRVERVVLSGSGLVPEGLQGLTRIADVPGVAGPLAGILAAMRWQPEVSWLLVACDMPSLCPEALTWLLDSRQPGRWATVPRRSEGSRVEPLLALYDRRCQAIFEEVLATGSLKIGDAARHEKIATPVIPEQLVRAWNNVNTPEELRATGP